MINRYKGFFIPDVGKVIYKTLRKRDEVSNIQLSVILYPQSGLNAKEIGLLRFCKNWNLASDYSYMVVILFMWGTDLIKEKN